MNTLFSTLGWCVLQVTLVAVAAWLLSVVARGLRTRHDSLVPGTALVSILALTGLAFVPLPAIWSYGYEWPTASVLNREPGTEPASVPSRNVDQRVVEDAAAATVELVALPAIAAKEESRAPAPHEPASLATSGLEPAREPAIVEPQVSYLTRLLRNWQTLLLGALAASALIGILHLLGGLLATQTYRRKSRLITAPQLRELLDVLRAELHCQAQIELREAPSLTTAATLGWRRAVILLPPEWSNWTVEQQRAVLAHEIAHVVRQDFLACVLAQLSVAVHFYHPLVHWLARRLRLEQELAADALAAAVAGGEQIYLQTLAELALRQADRPLGWPARSFLPTQGTFMRRIEMLRDAQPRSDRRRGRWSRWVAVALLVAGVIGVSALRSPGRAGSSELLAQVEQPEQSQPATSADDTKPLLQPTAPAEQKAQVVGDSPNAELTPINLKYIPNDAVMFVALRPAELVKQPGVGGIFTELFNKTVIHLSTAELPLDRIIQLTVILQSSERGLGELVLFETTERLDFGKVFLNGQIIPEYKDQESGVALARLDDKVAALGDARHVAAYLASQRGEPAVSSNEAWKLVNQQMIAAAVDMRLARTQPNFFATVMPRLLQTFSHRGLDAIWEETEVVVAGVELGHKLKLTVAANCLGKMRIAGVKDALATSPWYVRKFLRTTRLATNQSSGQAGGPGIEPESVRVLWDAVDKALSNVETQQLDTLITTRAEMELSVRGRSILKALVPGVNLSQSAARKAQSLNNAKQIMQAMHNCHDLYNSFPAAAGLGSDGKAKYPCSWRVRLLPFLDQAPLYHSYHFDEPWDSEHNKTLISKMPAIYRGPADDANSTSAAYYVLIGKPKNQKDPAGSATPPPADAATPAIVDVNLPTMFSKHSGRAGINIREIVDGTSNTIAIVEAKRDIPWTKPDDITFDPTEKLPELGGYFSDGFHAGFADGTVHFLPRTIPADALKAYLTPARGEIVPQR